MSAGVQYFRTTSSTTWVVPAGVNWVWLDVAAPGGGGGGGYTAGGAGGGGAAGMGCISLPVPVKPGNTITITIGAVGTAGTAGAPGTDGGNGGNVTVTGADITLPTWYGGGGGKAATVASGGNGGTSTVSTTGLFTGAKGTGSGTVGGDATNPTAYWPSAMSGGHGGGGGLTGRGGAGSGNGYDAGTITFNNGSGSSGGGGPWGAGGNAGNTGVAGSSPASGNGGGGGGGGVGAAGAAGAAGMVAIRWHAGVIDANVTQIDGNATASNSATLNLKQLNIVNSAGDAIIASSTGGNGTGVNASGNGTGSGIKGTGGSTGVGVAGVGGATSGSGIKGIASAGASIGIEAQGATSAAGFSAKGGATGPGAALVGGATSGAGLSVTTTSGDGMSITPTAGNAITATANGTSKHGIVATGGTAGTSDGFKASAGTGGVDIRGNITGNITGTVDTATNLTNAPTNGDLTAAMKTSVTTAATAATPTAAAVTGNVGGNVVGSVGSVVAAVTITAASVQAVWDALTSALTTVGSIGKLLVTNIDATISSRLASAGYTAPLDASGTRAAVGLASANLDTQLSGISTKTTNLPGSPAATGDAMTLTAGERNATADALLGRNLAGGSSGGRTVNDALRFLRNKWAVVAGTLTVYQEDDATPAWTGTSTTDASAAPITSVDPS